MSLAVGATGGGVGRRGGSGLAWVVGGAGLGAGDTGAGLGGGGLGVFSAAGDAVMMGQKQECLADTKHTQIPITSFSNSDISHN